MGTREHRERQADLWVAYTDMVVGRAPNQHESISPETAAALDRQPQREEDSGTTE